MSIPTPYVVTVRTPADGGLDGFGNPTTTWTEASWSVHSIAPGAMEEPGKTNRDVSMVLWTVNGPKRGDYPTSARCQIKLPGDDEAYEVNGEVHDWTRGPWANPAAGLTVELRRADG